MNLRFVAVRLSLLVAAAGLVPIAVVGGVGLQLLEQRTQRATQDALRVVAEQAAARISGFLSHQRATLAAAAALATGDDAQQRLAELALDAPGLGRVALVKPQEPLPRGLERLAPADLAKASQGEQVLSDIFLAEDSTPALILCVPARVVKGAVACAQLDLLELWRFVQRIRVGQSGYAVAFDAKGRVIASGAGELRSAILSGEPVPQSPYAVRAAQEPAQVPTRYAAAPGRQVLAGWAQVPGQRWSLVVEMPEAEALQAARTGQRVLGGILLAALALSVWIGRAQSQRVLSALRIDERWRTAGRIASGLTHDLGHRLRILQQTAALADAGESAYLPRIRDNLKAEVATLQKFVEEFSALGRDPRALEPMPLELGAFLESVRRTSAPTAEAAGVRVSVTAPSEPLWARADRHLLERALLNLVVNAIEASAQGAQVQLAVRAEGDARVLQVSDEGPGIAPERLPTLFDAFSSTKRTGAHLGMGLPNVKRIAEAHGGQVSVQSALGRGTQFELRLPACERPAPSVQSPAA